MTTPIVDTLINHPPTHSVVIGNIEGIEQALHLLTLLNDAQYCYVATPYTQSSIGAHLRHINDMYFALMSHSDTQGLVDYDQRRRGDLVETDRQVAIDELRTIQTWLHQLTQDDLQALVTIQSETSLYQQQVCQMPSTMQRELLFVASHTTHHFSVMRVNAEACQVKTERIFSYAPATASYLRSQA